MSPRIGLLYLGITPDETASPLSPAKRARSLPPPRPNLNNRKKVPS